MAINKNILDVAGEDDDFDDDDSTDDEVSDGVE